MGLPESPSAAGERRFARCTYDYDWRRLAPPARRCRPCRRIRLRLRCGRYDYDWEVTDYYNYFRDYDPAIGRYIQSDPIGLRGGINTYAYVGSNPLGNIDPLGLATIVGGTPAQAQAYQGMLDVLKQKIAEASKCCPDKAKQLMDLFDRWTINLNSGPMPRGADGDHVDVTRGRNLSTTFYSNSRPGLGGVSHAFVHIFPQNVQKIETGSSYNILPHGQRPWEEEANRIAQAIINGQDICSMFTGQPLGPNPIDDFYRNYDYRPWWQRFFGR